jgi:GT2 family glycosyltransferase
VSLPHLPEKSEPEQLGLALELRRVAAELATERRINRIARDRLRFFEPVYEELRLVVARMQATKFWQLRQKWFALKRRLRISDVGPSPYYDPVPIERFSLDDEYQHWRLYHAFRAADEDMMVHAVKALRLRPFISIIVPTYNTPEAYLRQMLDSVRAQVFPNWELCIADDASTHDHVVPVLAEYAATDSRIKYVVRPQNGHISAASNSALELASGEFIALLDHDDILTPDALFHVALAINGDPTVDMIYSDEDKIDDDGRLSEPFFKPDWSPERFLSQMYTAHLGVYRTTLLRALGGFRMGFEGSQDYDLMLRLTERTEHIVHIPRVLYHWRTHADSTASGMTMKPYAGKAALVAIAEALQRRGEPGSVVANEQAGGCYTVRYEIADRSRLVSVIVPTRDHGEDVERCLSSLFQQTEYPNFEVILVDNGSTEAKSLETFAALQRSEPHRLKVLRHDAPFNFSEINNFAVREAARGEYLLFLNNDTEVLTADWMSAMVEQAQRPAIGAVGAKLVYGDDRIQHAGVVLGIGGIAGHSHKYFPKEANGYFATPQIVGNVSAVTAACLMTRRSVFDEVGGFDEDLQIAFNDVDLCMRIVEQNYRIVYLPHVELYHYESKSRGLETTPEKQARFKSEIDFMERRWRFSTRRDPYYNVNLTLIREDFSLAESY